MYRLNKIGDPRYGTPTPTPTPTPGSTDGLQGNEEQCIGGVNEEDSSCIPKEEQCPNGFDENGSCIPNEESEEQISSTYNQELLSNSDRIEEL